MPLCFEKNSNLEDCFLFKKESKNKAKKNSFIFKKTIV
jgi:hypothetical protein